VCTAPEAVGLEVAMLFRRYGEAYREHHRPSAGQARAMQAIEACRTEAMGGHLQACDRCGAVTLRYHSCRDRHCPKCQTLAKERWVEARRGELLATRHDHVVFTLPHALNPLIQGNPRQLYGLLFAAAADTLLAFGRDPRWIGGEIGITLVLHSWGQNLGQHVHVHGLVTAGGLSPDGGRWLPAKRRFLFPVRALSRVFRGKYLELLVRAHHRGTLAFGGSTAALAERPAFMRFIATLRRTEWVVYAKPPFAGPEQVIAYLGRYTHRIAIANDRLVALEDDHVSFRWRDYRNGARCKIMRLEAVEFIRRFLLHVLPQGFMRIRHYGLFANRQRRTKLARCRELLAQPEPKARSEESVAAMMRRITGRDILACPHCGEGRLQVVAILRPQRWWTLHYATGPP
jgi:Putative transposase/Transposase zinc-binding domain